MGLFLNTSRFSRRHFIQGAAGALASAASASGRKKAPRGDKNVLLIFVDDLRPELGCYARDRALSPQIDRLAADSLLFERAYCQQAASNPSRASLLTGLRPNTIGVNDAVVHFRRSSPGAVTLPQYFRENGYATTAFGRIFAEPALDDPRSWSLAPWAVGGPEWGGHANQERVEAEWRRLQENDWTWEEVASEPPARPQSVEEGPEGPSWEAPDVADDELPDGQIARAAVSALRELAGQRFFVAVGFEKPHLPFRAPRRYFELYRPQAIELTDHPEPPDNAPVYALHDSPELRLYADIPVDGSISPQKARELIRAYYASISYVDAQVGLLLDALDELGLRETTAVVLSSDHGYHLGDLSLWNKATNFESATRTPLLVSAPGQRNRGRRTSALVELADLFPSLCDLCNLPQPQALEGSSFAPLFSDPDRLWKRAVFHQHPRKIPGVGAGMGYSMRTKRFRYTEWVAQEVAYKSAELYDYLDDPIERRNLAGRPDNVSLVNGLAGMLEEGWQASLPPPDPRSGVRS